MAASRLLSKQTKGMLLIIDGEDFCSAMGECRGGGRPASNAWTNAHKIELKTGKAAL